CRRVHLGRPGLADRSHQRRLGNRRQLPVRGGLGLPEHHRAGRLRPRHADRPLLHRPRLERAEADQDGVCLRAGDEGEKGAAVPGDGGARVTRSPADRRGLEDWRVTVKDEDRPAGALTRRDLMRAGAIGGALAIAGPLLPHAAAKTPGQAPAGAPALPFELEETTIAAFQEGMKSGRHTARSIIEAYLARIEELNLKGPELRAVIETNPEALALADALDAERKAKGPRGPLHGIPVLLKDNIGTHDRMTTTAGSLALEGSIPLRDAFLVARLREAGAVLLGKANLSEWANFRSTRSSSGWSSRGRQCRNPYALDRCPSGSSSGSAVAAAANLAAVTVGSETDGSIISPSSICGVVGIKPTLGLISRAGVIPIAHSQDTAGPICRTVADAAILLGAMTGVDERDEATLASRGKALTDYAKFLDPTGLRGAK